MVLKFISMAKRFREVSITTSNVYNIILNLNWGIGAFKNFVITKFIKIWFDQETVPGTMFQIQKKK